jgi:hypothetical protein
MAKLSGGLREHAILWRVFHLPDCLRLIHKLFKATSHTTSDTTSHTTSDTTSDITSHTTSDNYQQPATSYQQASGLTAGQALAKCFRRKHGYRFSEDRLQAEAEADRQALAKEFRQKRNSGDRHRFPHKQRPRDVRGPAAVTWPRWVVNCNR